jgi:hypothetical protein
MTFHTGVIGAGLRQKGVGHPGSSAWDWERFEQALDRLLPTAPEFKLGPGFLDYIL